MAVYEEKELFEPVNLCLQNGRLNPEAVGWSRRPLHNCNLSGRWLAKKRWNYWAVTTKTHLLSATISNIDYIGMVFIYYGDFERRQLLEKTIITPLGAGTEMPPGVMENLSFENKSVSIHFDQVPEGVRMRVHVPDFEGKSLEASFDILYPQDHETLNVVIPWNDRTFQFTAKHNTLPAQGWVRFGEEEVLFSGAQSFACLDYGRGIWPRRCAWNWGAASGWESGHTIGLNLGGQWTDGTGMNENAVCIDGRLMKISEDLQWKYDRSNYMAPWTIRTPHSDLVSLTFTPILEREAKSQIGPLTSEVHQMYGSYSGVLESPAGERVRLGDLFGWAEDHEAVW